jgi:hypothetical protein
MTQAEVVVQCPHCFEAITVLLDLSVNAQTYVEDCFVCCHPMTIRYSASGGEIDSVSADRLDD